MPTWGQIVSEINALTPTLGVEAYDSVRKKYLSEYAKHTGRNVILYATAFMQKQARNPNLIAISDEDMQGLMEVVHGANGKELDLVIHSPGGSPEAAESLVNYLRSRFDHIRVLIPQAAMSAACMMSCAADEIIMGNHSSLGPIDTQFVIQTPLGVRAVPAQAILDQFSRAQAEITDPTKANAWIPLLSQYGPSLLIECQNALKLGEELVADWLERFMFAGDADGKAKATEIAQKLAAHNDHKSHGRHLSRNVVQGYGLKVTALEDDQVLQDLTLSVFHSTTLLFSDTAVVKVIQNERGNIFMKVEGAPPSPAPPSPAPPP